jgi:sarcosine oxidase
MHSDKCGASRQFARRLQDTPMAGETADVVIVGGGGVGCATAYFLSRLAPGTLRVLVCERDPSYVRASTALAAGGIRQQFSTPENVLMSRYGYEFLERANEELAVGDTRPEIGLTPGHYLRLAPQAREAEIRAQVDMQTSLGATPKVLDQDALAAQFPWMNVADIAVGVLGGAFEGVFDPFALLQAFRRKSIAQGVRFRASEVIGVDRGANGRAEGVRLGDGSAISCGLIINAGGPRAASVAALAGLNLPVTPVKAHTFAFRTKDPIENCPIVLDHVRQLNFKPEGALFLAACPREAHVRDMDDFDVDPDLFDSFVWPALAHRVPQFDTLKQERGWVGHIEWNAFDGNPVIGPHPDCVNFIFANGFSGHGVQHLPAAGRAVAELVLFGEFRSLDLSRFAYDRIPANTPVRELV